MSIDPKKLGAAGALIAHAASRLDDIEDPVLRERIVVSQEILQLGVLITEFRKLLDDGTDSERCAKIQTAIDDATAALETAGDRILQLAASPVVGDGRN